MLGGIVHLFTSYAIFPYFWFIWSFIQGQTMRFDLIRV